MIELKGVEIKRVFGQGWCICYIPTTLSDTGKYNSCQGSGFVDGSMMTISECFKECCVQSCGSGFKWEEDPCSSCNSITPKTYIGIIKN